MFEPAKIVTSCIRAAVIAAGAMVLMPSYTHGDSALVSAIPPQISVTFGAPPVLMEGGSGATFTLTVTNIGQQMIGFQHNAISALVETKVEVDHVDATDTVIPPAGYSSTTCIKANGSTVVLQPGKTCVFTYLISPVAGKPCPGAAETPCDSGATTIRFTVNPNLGPAVFTEPTFIVEDVPKPTAEAGSLTLFVTGAVCLAGLLWLRRATWLSVMMR
jgi:archaellum component FlaG (FlaF/FlaG flagellin family)